MKVSKDPAKKDTADAWHFVVHEHDDGTGKSIPVAVSTWGMEGMVQRAGFRGSVKQYAEHIARTQAEAVFGKPKVEVGRFDAVGKPVLPKKRKAK